MQIRFKPGRGKDPLVVVDFKEAKNFWISDLSWAPTKEELHEIYRAMKRASAWK